LDKPLIIQFLRYITGLLRGNLGYSIYDNTSVVKMLAVRIRWTVFIVLSALILSSLIGTVMGTVSAWFRDKPVDNLMYSFMIAVSEIPSFLLGVLFLFLLAAEMKWFPLSGGTTVFASFDSVWTRTADVLHHATLPIMALTFTGMGNFYLLSRNSMLTVLSKNYIRTARAKGLKRRRILFHHALLNALPPVVARIFMSLGTLFGGAILVENVFAYPGVGRLMREAVLNRDYVLMQGIFLTVAVTVLMMNCLAEIIYKKLDPRVV
jgi:peptide/nickel transport system permease protein